MNYNINSSGLYDVNAYNLIATNATVLSTLNVNGNILGSNNTLFNNALETPRVLQTNVFKSLILFLLLFN